MATSSAFLLATTSASTRAAAIAARRFGQVLPQRGEACAMARIGLGVALPRADLLLQRRHRLLGRFEATVFGAGLHRRLGL